jgi:IstB-like ATP binding protein
LAVGRRTSRPRSAWRWWKTASAFCSLAPLIWFMVARRELALEAAINRLDRFHLLILDDLAYVSKDQAETSVLFELISARYEHRSMLITANQPFGAWGKVFPDPAMTLAAVDRLVHHASIFEINVDSYRRRAALERKQKGPGRPQNRATIKDLDPVSLHDNQTHT